MKETKTHLIKVAMVLNTNGLEYDDRVRKEILSVQKFMPNVSFKVFAIVPDNRKETGITEYGVSYQYLSLESRKKYKSASHLLEKAYEFYKQVKPELKQYDVVWCADCDVFFIPLLISSKTKLIWDLHELPEPFMNSYIMKKVFHYMENKCNLIFHANKARIEYLKDNKVIRQFEKHVAIRNYPDKSSFAAQEDQYNEKFNEFKKWLGDSDCVYIQGIYEADRRSYESLKAICEIEGMKATIIGRIDNDALSRIESKYGKKFVHDKFFFTGMIPQKATPLFIKYCKLSVIFYSTETPNNYLCEPNRLFQTVLLGLPVVVGCNPPMKEFVNSFKVGIALKSDGRNIEEIKEAIVNVIREYDIFIQNIKSNFSHMLWENQEELIATSFESVIK